HCWKRSNPVVIATRTCEPPPALCPVGKMTSALSSNGSDVRPNRSTWVPAVSRRGRRSQQGRLAVLQTVALGRHHQALLEHPHGAGDHLVGEAGLKPAGHGRRTV